MAREREREGEGERGKAADPAFCLASRWAREAQSLDKDS